MGYPGYVTNHLSISYLGLPGNGTFLPMLGLLGTLSFKERGIAFLDTSIKRVVTAINFENDEMGCSLLDFQVTFEI